MSLLIVSFPLLQGLDRYVSHKCINDMDIDQISNPSSYKVDSLDLKECSMAILLVLQVLLLLDAQVRFL